MSSHQLVPVLLQRLGELAGQFRGCRTWSSLVLDPGRWERLQPRFPVLGVPQHGDTTVPEWCWMVCLALRWPSIPAANHASC